MLSDGVGTGPQHEMKRVAEDDVGAVCGDLLGGDALDRAVGTDRHERRNPYRAPPKSQNAGPRIAVPARDVEIHVIPPA